MKKIAALIILFLLTISGYSYAEKVIGVTKFVNLTGDKTINWLGIGISDAITQKLTRIKEFILVDRTNVDKMTREAELGQMGIVDEKSAKKVGRALGADIIVIGNYAKYGNNIRINARLVEVESHKVIKQVQSTGLMNNIFELQDEIALKLIGEFKENRIVELKPDLDLAKLLKIDNKVKNLSAYEYYSRGQNYYIRNNFKNSIEMFQKAVSIEDRYSLAYSGLSKAYSQYYWSQWAIHEKEKDERLLKKSYDYARKALEISPKLDEANLSLARYYMNADKKKISNKWKLCKKYTRIALKINPNNAEAYYHLSRIYGYDQKKDEKYLKETLSKNKFHINAHLQLGILYFKQKKYSLAEKFFRNAIRIEPRYVLTYSWLGYMYDKMGKIQKSVEMYEDVLKKFPDYLFAIRNLGIAYRDLEKYDKSLEMHRKVVSIKKNDHISWQEIGNVMVKKEKYRESINYFKKSLRFKPDYYYALTNIGYAYSMMGEYQSAIGYLKKANKLRPKMAWAASHIGWIYKKKLNDIEKARNWYREAAKRDPKYKKDIP